jgi:hypothetical protein
VRLGLLVAAGIIIAPIAALVARNNGGEVVKSSDLPGAAVALEPVAESTSSVAVITATLPVVGTVPATVVPPGTLPATIPPPTTVPQPTTTASQETDQGSGGGSSGSSGESSSQPQQTAPTTEAPPPVTTAAPATTAPPRHDWGESEVVNIIRAVFPDDLEEHALFIAQRESRFDPNARNWCCTGLFQIYGSVHAKLIASLGFTVDQLTDPFVNSVVAYAIYQRSGWAPWGG